MGDKACLMAFVPADQAKPFLAYGNSIPDEDLAEDGRDNEPHVTVLYGLLDGDPKPLAEQLKGYGEVAFKLGKTSLFENDEYDVLKVGVEGSGLHDLNARVEANNDFISDYPDYTPHLTIAYLKSGKGKEYAGDDRFTGIEVRLDSLVFSDAAHAKTTISLGEGDKETKEAVVERLLA